MPLVVQVEDLDDELDRFAKFLKRQGFDDNAVGFSDNTVKTLVSALRTILTSGKEPDELILSGKSRSVYRRAYRLYKVFKEYEKVNEKKALAILRRKGSMTEGQLKKVVKDENFPVMMIKLVDTGKVYVSPEHHRIIYTGDW